MTGEVPPDSPLTVEDCALELSQRLALPALIHIKGRIVWVNPACLKLLALDDAIQLLGTSVVDWIVPEFHALIAERLQGTVPIGGSVEPLEICMRRRDGDTVWIEADGLPIRYQEQDAIYVVGRDITGRRRAEAAMQYSNDMLQTTLRCAPDALFVCKPDGAIQYVNDHASASLGYPRLMLQAMNVFDLVPVEWRDRYKLAAQGMLASTGSHTVEIRLVRADGCRVAMELNAAVLPNGLVYGSCRDITERKQTERELRIAATAFETNEGIMVTDADDRILRVNQAFCNTTGYRADEVIGQTPKLLRSGRHDANFYSAMWAHLNRRGFWSGEMWNRRKNGTDCLERVAITQVTDATRRLIGYVATFTDITRQKEDEEQIYKLAFFDALTGLPNRRLLFDRLEHAMASSTRYGHYGAVLFIDLDYFKILNDTKGHEIGDLMLTEVARRLKSEVRDFDTVSRLGGDEFVVLLDALGDTVEDAATHAETVAQKIRGVLSQPYKLQEYESHHTPSIGVALFHGREESIAEVIKHADIAMYQAKAAGRDAVRFYDTGMQATLEQRSAMEADLRRAINLQQLQLHYQIQVREDRQIMGVEALLRWTHPQHGNVPPNQFIGLAEETGLILPIGQWVLDSACAQIRAWMAHPATRQVRVSVNVSPVQFAQDTFVEQVRSAVARHNIDPCLLQLELTEGLMVKNVDAVVSKMREVKALGVGFAMDDFGTGFSSLSYLKLLPLDELKIDQSFVRDLAIDPNDRAIVQAIITMGEAFGLDIIAEGVETEEQREQLHSHGCYAYQGYLFAPPLSAKEVEALLHEVPPPTTA